MFFVYIKMGLGNHVLRIKIQKNTFFEKSLLRVILI